MPPEEPPEVIPEFKVYIEPNFVPDCMNDPNYNACVFWKNPVAQQNAPFQQRINAVTDLSDLQVHAVNILGTDESGLLRNPTIDVSTTEGIRIQDVGLNFKRPYAGNVQQARWAVQVMVYHWMQSFITYMKTETGVFHAEGKNVQVDAVSANYNNAFYRTINNDVRLGNLQGTYFGLDAEIAIHELGHANHVHASGYRFTTNQTVACPGGAGTCCASGNRRGCHRALAEGVADYMYGLIFPDSTAGGETISNSLDGGPTRCRVIRDFGIHDNLTVDTLNCANINSLGMIYASIWSVVKQQAEVVNPGVGTREVDTLFSEHLMVLLEDDYQSIYNKIIALDATMYQGRYTPLFRAEFLRRGIQL